MFQKSDEELFSELRDNIDVKILVLVHKFMSSGIVITYDGREHGRVVADVSGNCAPSTLASRGNTIIMEEDLADVIFVKGRELYSNAYKTELVNEKILLPEGIYLQFLSRLKVHDFVDFLKWATAFAPQITPLNRTDITYLFDIIRKRVDKHKQKNLLDSDSLAGSEKTLANSYRSKLRRESVEQLPDEPDPFRDIDF